jgi:MFS transporter, DHA2 family, multidrug resistance protein
MGLSLGLVFVPLTTISMSPIPKETMGNATSLFNLVRNLGGSIGISAVNTIVLRRAQANVNILGAHVNPYSSTATQMLSGLQHMFMSKGADLVTATQRANEAIFRMVTQQANMLAYNNVFRILGGLFLFLIPFIFLMHRPQAKGAIVGGH